MSLFTLLLWAIALGLAIAWRHTIGALFEHIADIMDRVQVSAFGLRVRPLAPFSAQLRAADYIVQTLLDVTVKGCEHATVWLFHSMISMFEWMAREIAHLSEDAALTFWRVTEHTIPNWTRRMMHLQRRDLAHERHRSQTAAARTNAHVSALRDDVHSLGHATTVALPRDVGRIRTREGRLEHDLEAVKARVGRLAALATLAGFSAFMWRWLERHGLRWLRCPALARIGSRLGCVGFGFLESLLFLAWETFAVLDLCRFADDMGKMAHAMRPVLMSFVDVEEALVGCHGATRPDALSIPRLQLPPTNAGLLLAQPGELDVFVIAPGLIPGVGAPAA